MGWSKQTNLQSKYKGKSLNFSEHASTATWGIAHLASTAIDRDPIKYKQAMIRFNKGKDIYLTINQIILLTEEEGAS